MRILVIAGNYPPNITGGGEIATQILAEGLADAGAVVKVLTCGKEPRLRHDGKVAVQEIVSPNIYWRFAGSKNAAQKAIWHALDNYNPRAFQRVRAAILDYRPDLVLTSILENFGAAAWVAARSVGTPVVDIVHSYYLECLWGGRFRNGTNCVGRCVRCKAATSGKKYFSRFVDGVVGVSRYVLDQHLSEGFFSRAASTCIYNPVLARAERPRSLRSAGTPTFGYLGKLLPTKGIEHVLQTFSSGSLAGRLIVAGDGHAPYQRQLREVSNRDFVEFVGWVDPSNLFERIDFLIFPSIWNEPFGRGIAEAMSCGIPVIGTRRGGIPELIRHGIDGYLYEPAVPGKLEEVVHMALSSDYARLSQAALAKSEIFSKANIIRQFVEFFEAIVSSRAPKAW